MDDKEIIDQLKKNMKTALTSESCDKHEKDERGIVVRTKPVFKLLLDGEYICPICERDKQNAEISKIEKNKFDIAVDSRNYHTFHRQNLLKDEGLLNASFGTYEALEVEEIENKDRATDAFKQYLAGATFNVWLTGRPGVGKSHLAMSIIRNLNERGQKDKSCLFVSVDEMLLKIRDSINNRESKFTEHYFVDLLSKVDYLVLDDLGTETGGTDTTKKATDFTLRVLYSIANARQNKSTIITTNLTRLALEKMYDQKLVSRLMKDTYLIKFSETTDKRIKNIEF